MIIPTSLHVIVPSGLAPFNCFSKPKNGRARLNLLLKPCSVMLISWRPSMQQEGQEHIRNAHPGTDCTPKHLVFIGTLQLRNFSFHNQKHSGSNHWEKVFVGAAFVQKYSHGHKQKEGLGIEWRHGASWLSLSPPPHLMWIRMTGKDLNNRLNIYFTIQVLGQQIPNCEPWPKELEKHMVTLSMQCIMKS